MCIHAVCAGPVQLDQCCSAHYVTYFDEPLHQNISHTEMHTINCITQHKVHNTMLVKIFYRHIDVQYILPLLALHVLHNENMQSNRYAPAE